MNQGRLGAFLLCCAFCVYSVLYYATFLQVSPPSNPFLDSLKVSTKLTTLHVEALNSTGGWAVREACQRRGGLEILFFVHTAPKNKIHRSVYRDTIADPVVAEHWNWSTVYFVGHADDETDATWNRLEAEALGDLVILPFIDAYRNLSYKYVMGMQWVLSNCPNPKYVVKIDDDILVNPSWLRLYLNTSVDPGGKEMHCHVWGMMPAYRDTESPWFVAAEDFPDKLYHTYCSGRSVIMPGGVLVDLYEASKKVRPYAVDDAYVTGDLALAAGIGHVDMGNRITWNNDQGLDVLLGRFIFAHMNGGDAFIARRALWDLSLRKEALRSSDERMLVKKQARRLKKLGVVNIGRGGTIKLMRPWIKRFRRGRRGVSQ